MCYPEEGDTCPSCKEGKMQFSEGRCQCPNMSNPPCSYCESGVLECDHCYYEWEE